MTQPLQTDSLEACPFCGSQPGCAINQAAGYRVVTITCSCGVRGRSHTEPVVTDAALSKAIAAWNTRAAPQSQAALVDALERLWTPPEEAWAGLARALMMAFDMNCKTPRQIFEHLERTGKVIPQWLRDEPEMKHLDHVPSKGTRAVIIYRAMLEPTLAALLPTPPEPRESEL